MVEQILIWVTVAAIFVGGYFAQKNSDDTKITIEKMRDSILIDAIRTVERKRCDSIIVAIKQQKADSIK